ncbi:hypothetical protein [Lysinibacter sp. HNR]|uniref:hypothetical protein n=1 Tax=Lysinibacter sp. HNR TaxID=3031408 RepID=UPI002434C287|nr:hypothetical protein [Lysinibacter sp. HNR]WGD38344.1 hypothetical protein FrondiHNR_05385 [Lysinibacter sp. HNR]
MSSRREVALPWIIISVIAVLSIVMALVFINIIRPDIFGSGQKEPQPKPSPTATQKDDIPAIPLPRPTTAAPAPPAVDPGPTATIPITQWGIRVDMPRSLAQPQYTISGNTVNFPTTMATGLPSACGNSPEGWGLSRSQTQDALHTHKVGDFYYAIESPVASCPANTELYNQIIGLYGTVLNSIKS